MFSMRSNYFRSVQLKVTVYFGKAKSKRKREKTENPIDNKKRCTKGKNASGKEHQVDTDLLCIYRKTSGQRPPCTYSLCTSNDPEKP